MTKVDADKKLAVARKCVAPANPIGNKEVQLIAIYCIMPLMFALIPDLRR